MEIGKSEIRLFLACLLLGILGELAFFHTMIGISYVVYIAALYWVFFWRFRQHAFANRRVGVLLLTCIWLLAASYALYSNLVFYALNILIIPALVVLHMVLVTSRKRTAWDRLIFLWDVLMKLFGGLRYNRLFLAASARMLRGGEQYRVAAKVGIGLLLALPLLLLVIVLLSSADAEFSRTVGHIPEWLAEANVAEGVLRTGVVIIGTLALFGFLQHLRQREDRVRDEAPPHKQTWDSIIMATVLAAVNSVYVLFVVIQFQYFFSGTLRAGLTYAEYARRGFFELVVVTLLNLCIVAVVLTFTRLGNRGMKRFVQLLLTLCIASSGVMLVSAFLRLSLYEEAYGFTLLRLLAHSFMVFLGFIFVYTLMKVWIERLQLRHFYFIAGLVYYTLLNVLPLDRIIVEQNLSRFAQTGKIDVHYLDGLSYTGVSGLADLYAEHPDVPELREAVVTRVNEALQADEGWQSFNLSRRTAYEKLKQLDISGAESK